MIPLRAQWYRNHNQLGCYDEQAYLYHNFAAKQ